MRTLIRFSSMLIIIIFLVSVGIFAKVPTWNIVPEKSSLTFTAIQNKAPVSAEFKVFSGNIHFAPDKLTTSNITIHVEMASVYAEYDDLIDTLKMADWFDVGKFPQATFQSKTITKVGDKKYRAEGTLVIRDKSEPVIMTFTLIEYSDKNATAKGQVSVKRLQFGVGQGEWASTDDIDDVVKIEFTVSATRR